jgi:two-component system chemotaxis response regulator CheY
MNGPDAYQSLKASGCKTPVVMMTSKNSMSDLTQMLEAGVSEYIMKPFTPDILIEKLEGALKSSSGI